MNKIINKLKKFKGISFYPFSLNINTFNGYAITILKIEWVVQGKLFIIGNSWCLLHLGFHNSIDNSFIFSFNFLGFLKKWFIKPRIIEICPNCNHKIQTYDPIGYEVFCDECESWININEVKSVKVYREGEIIDKKNTSNAR